MNYWKFMDSKLQKGQGVPEIEEGFLEGEEGKENQK